MKILIINDKYEAGGAENHAKWEKKILRQHGHAVKYLTLDPDMSAGTSYEAGHKTLCGVYSTIQKLWFRYFLDENTKKRINDELLYFKPDVIHLHNIYLSPKAVYQAIDGYHCIQTVHDYSIVCVKSTCVDRRYGVCEGIRCQHCFLKCFRGSIKERAVFLTRWLALKRNNALRKKYVKQFISPSACLTKYCNEHGFPTICINNPFDTNIALPHKALNPTDRKIFLYFGAVATVKGIFQLIDAFSGFAKEKNVELQIIGGIKAEAAEHFQNALKACPQISYLGKFTHAEVMEKLREIYAVVVPSLWIENYPTTVLEAMAAGCLVLASNRGGMPEMLSNHICLFDILRLENIVEKLEFAISLSDSEYHAIIADQTKYLTINNSEKQYYQALRKYLERC